MADDLRLIRAVAFKKLHEGPGIFVMPNPWDAGSAKMLTGMGFQALGTTSAGVAVCLGKPDGMRAVSLEEALQNAKIIFNATNLPVSADLENGYADEPEGCGQTIQLAAKTGLSGCSIEDATGRRDNPIYEFDLAVERIKAAVQSARSLTFPFTVTARAENLIHGRPDLIDTIKRLEAFADAGADVLFAPGLKTREEIGAVVRAVAPKPLNVVLGFGDLSLNELADLGVKRISTGGALIRAAYTAFFNAASEIRENGTFTFNSSVMPYSKLHELLNL